MPLLLAGYSRQRQIRIDNTGPGAVTLTAASPATLVAVEISLEWSLLASKNDLRVVRSTDGGLTGVEIPRVLASSNTLALFNVQADIPAGAVDETYYLVGVNSGAGAPPTGITSTTSGLLEDFEDDAFRAFLARPSWTRETDRQFAGSYSLRSDNQVHDSRSELKVAFYGTGLEFYWSTDTESGFDVLEVSVDGGAYSTVASGSNPFAAGNKYTNTALSNGFHRVTVRYRKDNALSGGADRVWIDNLQVFGTPVVFADSADDGGTYSEQAFSYSVVEGSGTGPNEGGSGPACWDGRTERLMCYLAKPFTKQRGSLLWTFLETPARELSGCTEEVVLVNAEDARGNGSFTIVTRFEPITAVSSVRRVDSGGNTLETYTVTGFDSRQITLSGTTAPRQGDYLRVSYTYLHKGLEFRVREAFLELNILTATGDFLDEWGRWFATPRLSIGKYGTFKYGSGKYGISGREGDTQYSRRIIDKIKQHRNTKPAIIAAVKRVTGGNPYIVEWFGEGANRGWVYKVNGEEYWAGEADPAKHLIWGQTSRFLSSSAPGGGACTIEVWIPQGTAYSTEQILQIVNQYKAAGIKAFVRYQPVVPETPVPETLPGMVWWYKADSLALADGALISSIANEKAGGRPLTSPTTNGAARPTFRTNLYNGLPAIRVAAGQGMEISYPSFDPPLVSATWTFYWLGSYAINQTANAILLYHYDYPNIALGLDVEAGYYGPGDPAAPAWGYESTLNGFQFKHGLAAASSGLQVLAWVFDTSIPQAKLYRNGTLVATSSELYGGPITLGTDFIEFFNAAGGNVVAAGDHIESAAYTARHDDEQVAAMCDYLKARAGIS